MNVNSKSSDTIPSSKVQKPTNAHKIIKGPEWKDNWQLCAPEDVVTPVLRVCHKTLNFFTIEDFSVLFVSQPCVGFKVLLQKHLTINS